MEDLEYHTSFKVQDFANTTMCDMHVQSLSLSLAFPVLSSAAIDSQKPWLSVVLVLSTLMIKPPMLRYRLLL